MPFTRRNLQKALRAQLDAFLFEHGFTKFAPSIQSFIRRVPTGLHLIEFDIAKYLAWNVGFRAVLRFEAIDQVLDRYFPERAGPFPMEYACIVSAHMNGIPHEGGPIHGWDLSSEGDVERAAPEMKAKLAEIVLPFFMSLSTLKDLRHTLESESDGSRYTSPHGRAEALLLCCALSNDVSGVRHWLPKLREYLASRPDSHWLSHFEIFENKFFADYPHLRS